MLFFSIRFQPSSLSQEGSKTADGYELQLGTNVLAHQFFTKLLLPTLLATARSASVPNSVRVVFTSSIGHHLGPNGFDPKDPARQKDRMTSVGAVGRWWLYGQSKVCCPAPRALFFI